MKKKKGFTLVELLAVIVILAIVALIATPIIMNVIEKVKLQAAERSAENYVRTLETTVTSLRISGEKPKDGVYIINEEGNLYLESEPSTIITISNNKKAPTSGSVEIKDGTVIKKTASLLIDGYKVVVNDNQKSTLGSKKTCILVEDLNSDGLGLGDKYACDTGDGILRNFYVLENGTKPVSGSTLTTNQVALLMSKNLPDAETYGCTKSTENKNLCEQRTVPDLAIASLESQTTTWINSKILNISLPTYEQIHAVNNGENLKNSPWIYDSKTRYWINKIIFIVDQDYQYFVGNGRVDLSFSGKRQIRPVITISKDELA